MRSQRNGEASVPYGVGNAFTFIHIRAERRGNVPAGVETGKAHHSRGVSMNELRILTGTANPLLARSIADYLGVKLSETLVSRFSDGEVRVQVQESVRGMDVFIV